MTEQEAVAYLTPHHMMGDNAAIQLTAGKTREAMTALHSIAIESRLRITALEALALEFGTLMRELVDIEGPQPGSSDWAVKVDAALASPLLAELLGKEAGR